jgi:hypothetical protein
MKAARARSAAFAWNAGRRVPVLCLAFAGSRGSAPSGGNREALSTVTASAGGPVRSNSCNGGGAKGPAHLGLFAWATGLYGLGGDT